MNTIITDLELLKKPAKPLEFIDENGQIAEQVAFAKDTVIKLKEILESNPNLLAISAPQIGIDTRIMCIRFNDIIKTFINPIVTKKSLDRVIRFEENASIPGKTIAIARPREISVVYYTDELKYEDNKLLDAAAAIFEQQVQLMSGVLPGEATKLIANQTKIDIEHIPMVVDAIYSGSGIVEDDLSGDLMEDIAAILTKFQDIFRNIADSILEENDTVLKPVLSHLFTQEKVMTGEIVTVDQEGWAREKALKLNENRTNKMIKKSKFKNFAVSKCKR